MSFGICGPHMPSALHFARRSASSGAAAPKPFSNTSGSAGITVSRMKRSILSSRGRTLAGGSKSISVLRLQLGGQVMRGVEADERDALRMPVEVLRAELQLADRCIAHDDAGPDHVMRCRAERQADGDADRPR